MLAILVESLSRVKSVVPCSKAIAAIKTSMVVTAIPFANYFRKSSLVVNASALASEVGDHEFGISDNQHLKPPVLCRARMPPEFLQRITWQQNSAPETRQSVEVAEPVSRLP
jgi:hypothetical protein